MIYKAFQDIQISRLGMGNMRLPSVGGQTPGSAAEIDWEAAHAVIDSALAHGITYFDTAYVYNGGDSERCVGACMKKHPRDSFYLATKFNVTANPDYKAVFEEQLERLQTDHIDFYLLHCLLDSNIDAYLESGAIDYFLEQKKLGRITYFGFSSHASPAVLKRFADHHDWDFTQIQLNYYDWYYGTAAEEYSILAERNIPIMVMEPVRGGNLMNLVPEAKEVLNAVRPDWSLAAWAMRFVKSLPQVQVVLSGMNSEEQLDDNCATFSDPSDLNELEIVALKKAVDLHRKAVVVPCTGCAYCKPECPMQIDIPAVMALYNEYKLGADHALRELGQMEHSPKDCIGCGSCTSHCPQSISAPDIMAELKEVL